VTCDASFKTHSQIIEDALTMLSLFSHCFSVSVSSLSLILKQYKQEPFSRCRLPRNDCVRLLVRPLLAAAVSSASSHSSNIPFPLPFILIPLLFLLSSLPAPPPPPLPPSSSLLLPLPPPSSLLLLLLLLLLPLPSPTSPLFCTPPPPLPVTLQKQSRKSAAADDYDDHPCSSALTNQHVAKQSKARVLIGVR
jgi:hypothetical protein